jgi:hypothetical protein
MAELYTTNDQVPDDPPPQRRSWIVQTLALVVVLALIAFTVFAISELPQPVRLDSSQVERAVHYAPQVIVDPETRAIARHVDWAIREALDVLGQDPRDDLSHTVIPPEFLRDQLSDDDQRWYDQVVEKMMAVDTEFFTDDMMGRIYDSEDIAPIWALTDDHPELFYSTVSYPAEGESIGQILYKFPSSSDLVFIETNDLDSVREEVTLFLGVANRIVDRMPAELSTYDKYRYLAYVLSLLTDYAYYALTEEGELNEDYLVVANAYGALVNQEAVCAGYSYAYLVLCRLAGLWCDTVVGDVFFDNPQSHQWNIVQLESGTYFLDVTWSDGVGYIGDEEWMFYFMMDHETLSLDHDPGEVVATGSMRALER